MKRLGLGQRNASSTSGIRCSGRHLHGLAASVRENPGQSAVPLVPLGLEVPACPDQNVCLTATRCRFAGLIHHSDRGYQYLSINHSERLAECGIRHSVGSRGAGGSLATRSADGTARRTVVNIIARAEPATDKFRTCRTCICNQRYRQASTCSKRIIPDTLV